MRPLRPTLALWLVAALAAPAAAELAVGDPAPGFSLPGSDGRTHALADHRGERVVVLAWYPKAFTKGCTIECKSLAENGHRIREYDVAYFMASVDPIDEVRRFARSEKADFPLLSDASKEVAAAYGVLAPAGYALRQTFYVGADGRILAIDREVEPATAAEDLVATLEALGVARRAAAPESESDEDAEPREEAP